MAKLRKGRILLAICILLALVYTAYYLIWGGIDRGDAKGIITEESRKQNLHEAEKAVQQYKLAKQSGSVKEACVHAKQAFALFGAAGFEEKMNKWVMVIKEECE